MVILLFKLHHHYDLLLLSAVSAASTILFCYRCFQSGHIMFIPWFDQSRVGRYEHGDNWFQFIICWSNLCKRLNLWTSRELFYERKHRDLKQFRQSPCLTSISKWHRHVTKKCYLSCQVSISAWANFNHVSSHVSSWWLIVHLISLRQLWQVCLITQCVIHTCRNLFKTTRRLRNILLYEGNGPANERFTVDQVNDSQSATQ